MRGTDDDELTFADADDANVAAVVALSRRVAARGLVGDVRPSLSMNDLGRGLGGHLSGLSQAISEAIPGGHLGGLSVELAISHTR